MSRAAGPAQPRLAYRAALGGEPDVTFTVAVPGGSVVPVQDPTGGRPLAEALGVAEPVWEGVRLDDRTDRLALFAFPGPTSPPGAPGPPGTAAREPWCLRPGVDLFALAAGHDRLAALFARSHRLAGEREVAARLARRREN